MGHGHGGGGSGEGAGHASVHKARYAVMQHYQAMKQAYAPGDPGFELSVGDFFHPGNKIMGIAIPFSTVLGTATTTSSEKLAENIDRRYLLIQNIDSADDLHIGFDQAATTSMLKIEPGGWYEPIMVPTSGINIRTDSNTAKFVILHG